MRPLCALLLVSVFACSKGDDGAKRTPEPPPRPGVEIPADLHIPVLIDGHTRPPVTRSVLEGLKPDFSGEDHRAWRLTAVLGEAFQRDSAACEAVGANGVSITLRQPKDPTKPQPVLTLNRRGEVGAAMIDPNDPFPDYHGRGGRLKRPGDPLPRLGPVKQLRVDIRTADAPQVPAGAIPKVIEALVVKVDGKLFDGWQDALADTQPLQVVADGRPRPAWPVRALAAKIGDGAVLVKVTSEDGDVDVAAALWSDANQNPTLRTNRRATNVKFQWSDAAGASDKASEIRGVTGLEFTSR